MAFNYNTADAAEVLSNEPYLDIYWDNAGGKMLEVAISRAALNGRLLVGSCDFVGVFLYFLCSSYLRFVVEQRSITSRMRKDGESR